MPGGLAKLDRAALDFLLAQLAPEQPVPVRSAAADVLSKAKLPPDQLVALAGAVKAAGPLEVDRLIDAYAQSTDETVGLSLVAALTESPGRSGDSTAAGPLPSLPTCCQSAGDGRGEAGMSGGATGEKRRQDGLFQDRRGGGGRHVIPRMRPLRRKMWKIWNRS